ncbi:MAG: hypothetical protein A2293_12445 [Elusimicrobia bacterium RIFOXYB2_FULL_49_7]|nr:MAG: hypothetical protein A2293_12445 [Elusimicrobia bacterium RIFOXYB2_FULL_49_7]
MSKKFKSILLGSVVCLMIGCAGSKATKEETHKLTESRASAEAAIKELRELRSEKAKLEAEAEKEKNQ